MTRQISRRAFIGGAAGAGALAAGGAAWAALLNRDDESSPAAPEPTAAPAPTPSAAPTLAPRAQGSQVIASASSHAFDTFDAQKTGKSAVLEVLGRTHSRLVNWAIRPDIAGLDSRLEGDLASSWEQPDANTVLMKLDPKARWQPKPPLNGRPVTADDVVLHFRRALAFADEGNAPLAQRYHWYATLDSADSPQPGIVRFRTKAPDPLFFDILAGEFAVIQAPEAVEAFAANWSKQDSDHVVGTGPWTFDWADEGMTFTAWTEGHRRPLLESLRVVEPVKAAQRFIEKQLDEAPVFDRRDGELIRKELRGGEGVDYVTRPRHSRDLVMSTFFVGAPPWNNPDLIKAMGALVRREAVTGLFGGRAAAIGGLPFGTSGAVITEKSIVELGLGWTPAEAKTRWDAAGGPGLGTVTIDFPSIFDPLYSASSVIIDALNSTLGPQFRPAVETYTTISKRALEGYYGNGRAAFWFGWGPSISSPDGRRYATELYGRGSPGQLLTGGAGASDPNDAAEIARNAHFGIVPWAQQFLETFRAPGVSGPQPGPFWSQHLDHLRST